MFVEDRKRGLSANSYHCFTQWPCFPLSSLQQRQCPQIPPGNWSQFKRYQSSSRWTAIWTGRWSLDLRQKGCLGYQQNLSFRIRYLSLSGFRGVREWRLSLWFSRKWRDSWVNWICHVCDSFRWGQAIFRFRMLLEFDGWKSLQQMGGQKSERHCLWKRPRRRQFWSHAFRCSNLTDQ